MCSLNWRKYAFGLNFVIFCIVLYYIVFPVLFYQRYILSASEHQQYTQYCHWTAANATINNVIENVEQIGKIEVQKCLNDNSEKVQRVNLNTFEELHSIQQQKQK